jgi:hypothetical protein
MKIAEKMAIGNQCLGALTSTKTVGVVFAAWISMDHNYQQLDMQALLDLLAEETQNFTKAFVSGKQEEMLHYRARTDALVVEIKRRKNDVNLPPTGSIEIPPNDYFEVAT